MQKDKQRSIQKTTDRATLTTLKTGVWARVTPMSTHAVPAPCVLARRNNISRVDMSLYFDILSWCRANQSDLFPWCCVLNREATNTNVIVFNLTRPGPGANPRSTTLEVSTLTITPPMQMSTIGLDGYYLRLHPISKWMCINFKSRSYFGVSKQTFLLLLI